MSQVEYTSIDIATGATTGSGQTGLLTGFITSFHVVYTSIADAGTVITVKQTIGGYTETLATITGKTNGVFRVQLATVKTDGSTATNQYIYPYIHNQRLDFAVSNSDEGTIEIWTTVVS